MDTGVVVFNAKTYPNFVELLAELGVASRPSDMSFSVRCESRGLEYASGDGVPQASNEAVNPGERIP